MVKDFQSHHSPQPSLCLLDGESLTLEAIEEVAYQRRSVALHEAAIKKMLQSRAVVEGIINSEEVVYSINTGFGSLSAIVIPKADVDTLQLNFVRSHAAGCGPYLSEPVTRAMMLLRANTLAKGYSGVRPDLVNLLIAMLNSGVYPCIPSQGSLGASGDLAPLAHLALVLIGEGQAKVNGELLTGAEALAKVNLQPVLLKAKEGLALVNGTQMMTAIGALAILEAKRLCSLADVVACMSVEGFLGSHKPFLSEVQQVRPHPGQADSAYNCRKVLAGSEIAESHADCKKVQDPYSFRCTPQVHGAVRDTVTFVYEVLSREINAATDNPLIFPENNQAVSQGNFHGEPVAMAMDFLAIAASELGNISERRIDKLNDPHFSELPAFLTQGRPGLNSGTMIVHYTAASLVAENKVLAHPASVDSIPSSNNKEDHVSMGSIAARKCATILDHVYYIVATELFCALQALRFRQPLHSGPGVMAVFEWLCQRIAPIEEDRVFVNDIQTIQGWLKDGTLISVIESQLQEVLR